MRMLQIKLLIIILACYDCAVLSSDLEIKASINLGASEINEDDGVEMVVEFTNKGAKTIVCSPFTPARLFIEVSRNKPSGNSEIVNKTSRGKEFFENEETFGDIMRSDTIAIPGKVFKINVPLSKTFDLSVPGKYTVNVKYFFERRGAVKDKNSVECNAQINLVSQSVIEARNLQWSEKAKNKYSFWRPYSALPDGGWEATYREPAKDSKRGIAITSAIEKFNLGSSPIRVTYANNSETDNWVLLKPDSCGEIVACVSCTNWSMKYAPNGSFDLIDRVKMKKVGIGPRERRMEIKPGLTFEYAFDLYSMPMQWEPGVYEMWLYDCAEKVCSNKIKFRLEASSDAVSLLTRMALEEKQPNALISENHRREIRRNFALNWLAKTFDDLKVNPITDRDNQAVLDAKMEQNRFFIDEFMAKWPTRKDSAEMKTLFQVLNSSVQTKPPSIVPPRPDLKPVKPPAPPPQEPTK